MAKLIEIQEQIIKYLLQQVTVTDENNINDPSLIGDIVAARENLGIQMYKSRTQFPAAWFLETTLTYDSSIQDSTEYIVYKVPRPINNIINYAGDMARSISTIPFLKSSIHQQIPFKYKLIIINGLLRIYSGLAKDKLTVTMIPANPMELPDWNMDKDEFPIDGQSQMTIVGLLGDAYYKNIQQRKADLTSDGTNT